MMKKSIFSAIIITAVSFSSAFAADAGRLVAEGNKHYKKQAYTDALKAYQQALSAVPDSSLVNFDAGAAQYKTKDYSTAVSSFEKAALSEDKQLEAKANYNLGNSRYMLGVSKEESDLSGAVAALEGALKNFSRARELDAKDEDAKANYLIAEQKLKELKEKLKQQPPQKCDNPKQDQQQEKNEQSSANQEQQQGQQQEQQQGQQQEQPSGAEQKQDQAQDQKRDQAPPEEQRQSAQSSGQELKDMSPEEANMLLDNFRQEEARGGMLKDEHKGSEEKVEKDW